MFNQKNFFIFFILVVIVGGLYALSSRDDSNSSARSQGLNIESWQSDKGAKVLYVHAPELPMVDVRIVFDAGSARDGGKPGLASLTNLLLDHGAGEWNTNQIVERFDSVGAQFGSSALRDMAIVSLRSLTDKSWLEKALDTTATILQKPKFISDELERERKRILVALKNQKESAGALASIAFYKALYGDHPYATPTSGDEDSVKEISRDDVAAFYKKYYVAKNATVVIVGAIEKSQAKKIVAQLVDGLEAGEKAPQLPDVKAITKTETIKQVHPSKQTHIMVGQEGKLRGDVDYFALYVGNHILGGSGFGSRIVEEIRENRGLAYSSYSYFSAMRKKGPFVMGLQTKNEQAEEALKVLFETVRKFIENGPTEEELISAKKNITGGFPLRIDSNRDITEYVAMIGFYDLPLDYLTNFNAKVEEVTVEQIKDAFERRVHPDKMVVVMVGGEAKTGQTEESKTNSKSAE